MNVLNNLRKQMTEELWITNQPQVYRPTEVICSRHGTHPHTISSTIPGYQGYWCMLCALEQLGPSLPTTNE
jgi:hypothetical protein